MAVCPRISISIREIENIRWIGHQYAILPAHNTGRQPESVSKQCCRIRATVLVCIVEDFYPSRSTNIQGIPRHFSDPDSTIFIDIHGDRVGYQGFCRDEVYTHAIGHLNGFQCFLGLKWWTVCRNGVRP